MRARKQCRDSFDAKAVDVAGNLAGFVDHGVGDGRALSENGCAPFHDMAIDLQEPEGIVGTRGESAGRKCTGQHDSRPKTAHAMSLSCRSSSDSRQPLRFVRSEEV